MENLSYIDFNDLFVIAVGILMAYIIIEPKDRKKTFLGFLSIITNKIQSIVLDSKTKPQQKEEEFVSKINYYLNTNRLKDTTKGALSLISINAKEVVINVKNLESWFNSKIKFHTKSEFLNVISCDGFLYGIFVLFIGALHKVDVKCDGVVELLLLFMFFSLLHCLICEKIDLQHKLAIFYKPSIFLHASIFLICLIVGVIFCREPIFDIKTGWLAILSVVACFSGFLAYFVMTICANIVLLFVMLFKIHKLNINSAFKNQNNDFNRYQEELDKIDADIKNENIAEQLEISGGEGSTEA